MKSVVILSIALVTILAQHAFANDTPPLNTRENHWHVSNYWADSIEGHGFGNHALYCGDETIPACDSPDTIGGVGPDWLDDVEWRYSVVDPSQSVTVRLTGLMNVDLPDVNWDFLILYIQRGEELQLIESWTGIYDSTISFDFTTVLNPGEFSGPGNDEVRLAWRVWTSLDGWDDVDCVSPSHGACQIDDLSVYIQDDLITFDTFEPGTTVHWNPVNDGLSAVDPIPGAGQLVVKAYPNPFNPRTAISFNLPRAADVTLSVFDIQGRLIRSLLDSAHFTAGSHQQMWDGRDSQGQMLASGVYFYRFNTGQEKRAGKLILLK